jgi:hypothetical protein
MSLVYLVGTCHWDLKGPERLRKFLGFVRPTSIGLEASQGLIDEKLRYRQRVKEKLKEMGRIDEFFSQLYKGFKLEEPQREEDLILKFLEIQGYEQWVPYEHKQEDNPAVKIYPVHNHAFLSKRSPEIYHHLGEEFIDEDGKMMPEFFEALKQGTLEEFQREVDEIYLDDDPSDDPKLREITREIDDIMEPKIRDVVAADPNGTIVIVAGAAHFFADYGNNLYQRLQDLSPHRLKLPEVDQFK